LIRRYDSILFDFDGVLADTEPIHWACWVEIVAPLGIDLSWDTYCANCIGISDLNMLEILASCARHPVDAESLRPHYARKKDLFRMRIAEANPCAVETVDLIRSLSDYRLAVVTSSGRLEVEPVLNRAGIRQLFGAVVFGDDVTRHKPSPEPYLLAATRLGVNRPLVVEDSVAGVASAKAAGFDVIQVPSVAQVSRLVQLALR
jgi:HAD superfamily hydrolase (TIGR01509 family)